MDLMITRERLAAWRPCSAYAERIAELIPSGGVHLRDALKRNDIPAYDLVWLATRHGLLPDAELRLFACRCARRALEQVAEPDPRSITAIETVERFALGTATVEELEAAQDGAWAAWKAWPAWEASAAARATDEDACEAAWAAADSAAVAAADAEVECATQLADLQAIVDRLHGYPMDLWITKQKMAAWTPRSIYMLHEIEAVLSEEGMHLRDLLNIEGVDPVYLIAVAARPGLLPESDLRLFACACAQRAIDAEGFHCKHAIKAIELAQQFAHGEVTQREMEDAGAKAKAQRLGWSSSAAWLAASTRPWFATETAKLAQAAAGSHAQNRETERRRQIEHLLEIIDRLDPKETQ